MRRLGLLAGFALVFAFGVSNAQAGGWSEFWHRFHVDFHRNNCWPEPFIHADRAAVRAPFELMKHNGWRLQNTLNDSLFHYETHALTHAGALKIRWIVTQNPSHRRTVYVLRAPTVDDTRRRVDAVQQAIAGLLPTGPMPPVVVTSKVPLSGSGDYFDQIDRRVKSTIPTPRLPELQDGQLNNQ